MLAKHDIEHQDVIRIIGSSKKALTMLSKMELQRSKKVMKGRRGQNWTLKLLK